MIADNRLDAIRKALKPCGLDREALRQRLHGVLLRHGFTSAVEADERAANKDARATLKQAYGAAQKLERLLADPALGVAMSAAMHRRHVAGTVDYDAPVKLPVLLVAQVLPDLIGALSTAIETPQSGDKRRATASRQLVVELASLYTDATGEPVRQPTYDPVTGEIGGRFVSFLRLATLEAWGPEPPSDEAIRHTMRDAIELGEIGKNKSGSRASTNTQHGATLVATQSNEVAEDDEQADRSTV